GGVRVFQHVQLLSEFLIVDCELNGIGTGSGKQGDAPGAWGGSPALRSGSNFWSELMRRAQANLGGRLAAQIPPDPINACFSMTGSRPRPGGVLPWLRSRRTLSTCCCAFAALRVAVDGAHDLAAGIADREPHPVLCAGLRFQIEIDIRAVGQVLASS